MALSAVAAIGLAVVLSVLFLPKLLSFEGRPEPPIYILERDPDEDPHRIVVERAFNARPFANLTLALIVDPGAENRTEYIHPLDPDGDYGSPVSVVDDDGDGVLTEGDYFLVELAPDTPFALLILQEGTSVEDGGVGGFSWPPP